MSSVRLLCCDRLMERVDGIPTALAQAIRDVWESPNPNTLAEWYGATVGHDRKAMVLSDDV